MLAEWANRALVRAGSDYKVSKMWPRRFEEKLPVHLNLSPVVQKTKDKKQLDTGNIRYLHYWYNQLANMVKDLLCI
jgi:hypothetical protein